VLEHRAEIERIIVHCDAGVSRSAAVGAALARAFSGDDAEFFAGRYRPNVRVYRTLLETAPTLR
jgi:protein-tyrosine phosphatase